MQAAADLVTSRHVAATTDGWLLDLKRIVSPRHLAKHSRPIVIIPGYGMNAFIFGFHPRGTSMERCLAEAGFEVWSANLRAQGGSKKRDQDAPGPSMRAYAEQDVSAIVEHVLDHTSVSSLDVDLIGCSLGGTIAYAYLALKPSARVHGLVAIGSPLRWERVHPVLKGVFSSPWLASKFVMRGTRRLMRAGVPLLSRFPSLLGIYMNTENVDLTALPEMLETVEDPYPRVNQDLAKWISKGDLVLHGVNITDALRSIDRPLLVVVSNRDGIVPEDANLSVTKVWGGRDVEVLRVGDEKEWYAHADLFIGHRAPDVVFAPLAKWLHAHGADRVELRTVDGKASGADE